MGFLTCMKLPTLTMRCQEWAKNSLQVIWRRAVSPFPQHLLLSDSPTAPLSRSLIQNKGPGHRRKVPTYVGRNYTITAILKRITSGMYTFSLKQLLKSLWSV